MLLTALRNRSGFAIAAPLLLTGVSAEAVWRDMRRRRLGRTSALILALWLWLLSSGLAVGAVWLGVF